VKAKDIAGNFGEIKRKVIRDTYPPSLVITYPEEGFITNKLKVITITGVVSDEIAFAELKINGIPVTPSGGLFAYQIELNEGENLINVEAKDKAGNVNRIMRKVIYDTIPPEIKINEPIDKSITNKKEVYLNGTAENDTKIEVNDEAVELENGAFSTIIQLEEGKNKIKVKGTDRAGNVAYAEVVITLDSKKPVLTVDLPPLVYTNSNEYLINGSVDEDAEIFLNDEKVEIKDGKFSEKIMLKDEGEKIIKISAKDKAGNNVSIERKIIVDRTAPSIEIITPKDKTKTKDKRIEIKGKTEPKAKLYINGIETVVNENGEFSYFVDLTIGINNITFRVLDTVGNERTESITVLREKEEKIAPKGFDWLPVIGIVVLLLVFGCIAGIFLMKRKKEIPYQPYYYQPPYQPMPPPIQPPPQQYYQPPMQPPTPPVQPPAQQPPQEEPVRKRPEIVAGYAPEAETELKGRGARCYNCNGWIETTWYVCPYCDARLK
ncbi:MAG: hypothetical protein AB1779_09630, partial [Candidatus Thermoplasmatota archaeon]